MDKQLFNNSSKRIKAFLLYSALIEKDPIYNDYFRILRLKEYHYRVATIYMTIELKSLVLLFSSTMNSLFLKLLMGYRHLPIEDVYILLDKEITLSARFNSFLLLMNETFGDEEKVIKIVSKLFGTDNDFEMLYETAKQFEDDDYLEYLQKVREDIVEEYSMRFAKSYEEWSNIFDSTFNID